MPSPTVQSPGASEPRVSYRCVTGTEVMKLYLIKHLCTASRPPFTIVVVENRENPSVDQHLLFEHAVKIPGPGDITRERQFHIGLKNGERQT